MEFRPEVQNDNLLPFLPNIHLYQQLSSIANVLSTEQRSCFFLEGMLTAAALPPKPPRRQTLQPTADQAMAGPAQRTVLRLKVVKGSEAVRRALRGMGYSRSRISQLMTECEQYPPEERGPTPPAVGRGPTTMPPKHMITDNTDNTDDAQPIILILS